MIQENIIAIKKELPPEVKLVAVSKFHPVEAIREAYGAGQRCFGENRPQEFGKKVEALADLDLEWHFIGHLQTNKLKLVLPYVTLVQSVDSFHLLEAIDKWGRDNGRIIDVLLELHLGAEETKQGFDEEELWSILQAETSAHRYRIRGLMGMATNTEDEAVIEADFKRIEGLFRRIREEFPGLRESFTELSIGMSQDWPIAVRHGATMVRIGTDIFGPREY